MVGELARRVELEEETVSRFLEPFRLDPSEIEWRSLRLDEKHELTLGADSDELRGAVREFV
jgi:hypothetical protein